MRNLDYILPIYHPPQRAHTLPSTYLHSDYQVTPLVYGGAVPVPTIGKSRWFTYIVEYAPIIGLAIAAVGLVVSVIAVVVK